MGAIAGPIKNNLSLSATKRNHKDLLSPNAGWPNMINIIKMKKIIISKRWLAQHDKQNRNKKVV